VKRIAPIAKNCLGCFAALEIDRCRSRAWLSDALSISSYRSGARLGAESPRIPSPRSPRPGGGIGRRGRLKIGGPHGRVGSNPTPGIRAIVPVPLRVSRASQAARILLTYAQREKADYETAPTEVRRGSSGRVGRKASSSLRPRVEAGSERLGATKAPEGIEPGATLLRAARVSRRARAGGCPSTFALSLWLRRRKSVRTDLPRHSQQNARPRVVERLLVRVCDQVEGLSRPRSQGGGM
jgi:hypothetical protein